MAPLNDKAHLPSLISSGGLGFIGTGGQNPNSKIRYIGIGDITSKLKEARELANEDTIGVGLSIEGYLDKDACVLDQILSMEPKNLWLSTHGAKEVNFGPFCRLATSTRIPVNLFVQVDQLFYAQFYHIMILFYFFFNFYLLIPCLMISRGDLHLFSNSYFNYITEGGQHRTSENCCTNRGQCHRYTRSIIKSIFRYDINTLSFDRNNCNILIDLFIK